jgi:hypothetical protein
VENVGVQGGFVMKALLFWIELALEPHGIYGVWILDDSMTIKLTMIP